MGADPLVGCAATAGASAITPTRTRVPAVRTDVFMRWYIRAMFSPESIAFLKKLLDTPGPSGFESAPARVWRDQAREFAEVSGDVAGNSIAEVNAKGAPTIMLAGHISEIGALGADGDGEWYEES